MKKLLPLAYVVLTSLSPAFAGTVCQSELNRMIWIDDFLSQGFVIGVQNDVETNTRGLTEMTDLEQRFDANPGNHSQLAAFVRGTQFYIGTAAKGNASRADSIQNLATMNAEATVALSQCAIANRRYDCLPATSNWINRQTPFLRETNEIYQNAMRVQNYNSFFLTSYANNLEMGTIGYNPGLFEQVIKGMSKVTEDIKAVSLETSAYNSESIGMRDLAVSCLSN